MSSTPQAVDWHARAQALKPHHHLYINGRFVPALSGANFECISPIDGSVVARVAAGDGPDVDGAVASGRAAFDHGGWSRAAPKHRKEVLLRFAALLRVHAEELAL